MKLLARTFALAAAAAFTVAAAFAQTPSTASKPAKPHHGLMSLLHRPKHNGASTAVKKPLFAGNIIGNKRTHVYHMPGDKGALPAPKNRVYFRTQAQAIAAGYRHAGTGGRKGGAMSAHKTHHKQMTHH